LIVLLGWASPLRAQASEADAGIATLVTHLEETLRTGARESLRTLLTEPIDPRAVEAFSGAFFVEGVDRAVARERDRVPLEGSLPGDGYRLILDFFSEARGRARILTARVDVSRSLDGDIDSWRIVDLEQLTLVEGLFRLNLNTARQFAARNYTIESEDLELRLHDGAVFEVESADGITGLVLVGRGTMHFSPAPETERGQLRIFAGSDILDTPFETAYIRLNAGDYEAHRGRRTLTAVAPDARLVKRALEVMERESSRSFNIDLSDVSPDQWYLMPPPGDFLAEVRTRKYGTLTYAHSQNQPEDITLFNRERRRTIALYPSADKLASVGATYNEDELSDYDITNYDLEASIDPTRAFVRGRARIRLRARSSYLSTLTLRLANTLTVTGVSSLEFGRLLHLRIRNQNGILVNLPTALGTGAEITLLIDYAGQLPSQRVDAEVVAMGQGPDDLPFVPPEPSYLLSTRSYWYPQNSVSDYTPARLRIGLPDGWECVASGQATDADTSLRDLLGPVGAGRAFTFVATRPVRYLSVVVSRFERVADLAVAISDETDASDGSRGESAGSDTTALTVDANPRQAGRGREVAESAADILRFYDSLMGDSPYPSMSIAVVEDELPGGHSPAYAVILNSPPPASQTLWRNDPAVFQGFPEFFLAHELAHQWWGQAVGWKNYHEQWISEGFAQYFSALYARQTRGEGTFADMLKQFRRWSLAESDQGPVYLGYRLGHVKGDTRIFRALVYNKGAAVLHMLRRLVGDEAFFSGLRRFYTEQRYQKAGTDDFARAMEAESGISLDRFFARWIYGATVPRIRVNTRVAGEEVVVRFEQVGNEVFDIPVTVSITYADGQIQEVVVPVTDRQVEKRIPVAGAVKRVQVNRDFAAIAEFDGP